MSDNPYDKKRTVKVAQFRVPRIEKFLTCPECWSQDLRMNSDLECECPECNIILGTFTSDDVYNDTIVNFKEEI